MPIATGSPNHSNTPLPTDNTKSSTSSHDYSSDDSSMERGSPLGSPASPLSPMYNFEPVYNKTVGTPQHSQPSQLGAQLGDSRPSLLPHRRLKDMLKGGAGGATSRLAASPLAEKTAETQISEQNVGNMSEARVMESQDWFEYAQEEEEDVEAAIRSGDVIEGEEGQEQDKAPKARIVAVDFDDLCAQYMPKEIGGRQAKFTTDVIPYAVSDLQTPANYKEHVFYLNRGWGTAVDIQREIKQVDLSMVPLQISNPSPVDAEPGFITALKCLKTFGYAIHIFTMRPKSSEIEIEAFLKIYGITVGVGAEDDVAAIWSGRAAKGELRDITAKDLGKEAAVKGKMSRLLGGGFYVETIRLINPFVVLADTSANSPPLKHPEAPVQDPYYASPGDRNFGVNILTFGKCVKPGRTVYTDEVEMGIAMSRVRGWAGVVNYLKGMEEDQQGDTQRLDMSEAVACQSIASED